MVARVWIGFMVIALLCAFTFTIVHGADPLVGADDDEWEDEVEPTPRPGVPLFPEKTQPSKTLQQADDTFDADEFEGITVTKPVVVEEETVPEPVEPQLPPKPKFGPLEVCYIAFIVIFIGNYFYGKKTNEKIATTWGQHFQGLFSNFNKFGENDRFIITKESAYTYTVTCSGGRPRCAGAVFTLDLNKRHDLSSYLYQILSPHKDTLTIDVAMYPNQPFSFVLAKKKEEKQVLKTYKDISTFVLPVKTLPARLSNYVVHTDSVEILDTILTREVVDALAANEQYFYSLGYSDVSNTYIGQKTILRIVYRLPPVTDMKKLADLMRIVFPLIDSFASVSLTKNNLIKNENARKKHVSNPEEKTEHEQRQEMAQKKKQDRLQAERAAYDKMTPEAQRRFDEKEEKRKVKAKQGRVKVMYS